MFKWLSNLASRQMVFRRIVLIWAMTIITYVIYIVADPILLVQIGAAGATIVTGIIGILTTVISFYQWHRNNGDSGTTKQDVDVITGESNDDAN